MISRLTKPDRPVGPVRPKNRAASEPVKNRSNRLGIGKTGKSAGLNGSVVQFFIFIFYF
jgi:hypothetical protein